MSQEPDEIEKQMIEDAGTAADNATPNTDFEVKGPSDQHIEATEKAAAEAVEGSDTDTDNSSS